MKVGAWLQRTLLVGACVVGLLPAHVSAASSAALREAEQDARNAFRHGDYPTAIRLYEDCLTQSPDNPRLLTNLGTAYFQNDQPGPALKTLRRAVQVAPRNGSAHRALGIVLYWQKADAEAIKELEQAIQLDGKDSLAHKYLSLCYQRTGDKRRAQAETEQVRRSAPLKRP